MKGVFISYVSENIEIVDLLYQELKSHGIQVWRDRDRYRSRTPMEARNSARPFNKGLFSLLASHRNMMSVVGPT